MLASRPRLPLKLPGSSFLNEKRHFVDSGTVGSSRVCSWTTFPLLQRRTPGVLLNNFLAFTEKNTKCTETSYAATKELSDTNEIPEARWLVCRFQPRFPSKVCSWTTFALSPRCTEPSSKGILSPATMQEKTRSGTSEVPEAMWLVLAFSTTDSLEGMRRDNGFVFAGRKH